ncbi:hypothetical protein BS47DRAFT_426789 [Hydnum rufescens UP504]|uniref:Uncharacterized protein n=1 Tax=Hydnum rufescens UP504 TaxID=1448309 RepID=A0A9P6DY15_9AGAM|nr:hypothetical protein BS47DRAFT_426789 [Hydnum rufescens UP504]
MPEMQEVPRQTRFQRLFGFLTLPQFRRSAKGDTVVEMPPRGISTDALEFAETALKGIPIAGAKVEISAVLNIIKGFSIAPALNEKSLDQLESHVRLLAELLEPLAQMESYQFSDDLQHQLRRLGRELHAISLRMKKSGSSTINRRLSLSKRNENVNNATALPMYPVSTIEAVMRSSGIISNSSCGLIPFLDWILQSEEVADDRIGTAIVALGLRTPYTSSFTSDY